MISVHLKELRERKGLTQDELARRINTSRSNIANYENNKNLPSVEILKRLANQLGCSIDYLLEETKNRIKQLRQEFNFTQQELADNLGLKGKSSIAMYENGSRNPSYLVLTKMSKLFSCTIDYLIGYSDYRGDKNMEIFTEVVSKFNKEEFANLINLAMGNRSQNAFALSCDISPSHLSRLRRCLLDTPPSPTIIRNMAEASQGRVKYMKLMKSAGYLEYEEEQEMGIFTEMDEIEKRVLEIKVFAEETLDRMVEMKMTHDDYDYFKHTLDNFVSRRQIGKE